MKMMMFMIVIFNCKVDIINTKNNPLTTKTTQTNIATTENIMTKIILKQ